MKLLIFLITVLILPVTSIARKNIAFIGLSGDNAPSLEKGYERLLREKLTMEPDLHSIDYLECQKYRRAIKFDDYPTVSRKHAETLIRFTNDSTLLLWGMVKEYRLYSERKNLIFSNIKGELVIGLHVFSLLTNDFLFTGNVKAIVDKSKGLTFFGSLVPISATEQSELIEMLQSEAVSITSRIISAVIRGETGYDNESGISDENPNNEPSISDVFSMPSIEPAQIEPVAPIDKAADSLKGKNK